MGATKNGKPDGKPATKAAPKKRRTSSLSPQQLKLRGVYMGLLNGVSLKNKAVAKKLRQEKGTARAIGFLRGLSA